ncbi:MAG: 30S ribosomal protein S2 [Patescibacteria group bacterium]|jgi:small subunit ribosomal protein S2|nr:30S ribosomal protein S2 [Patescibacteria group bacterium]MDD5172868.1 30S ribosomal protein S2 [Patescibacteria group bacterium]
MDKQEKTNKIKIPSTLELAQAGAHLGHRTTKRSPKMKPYIYGVKNTIHIIDLDKTVEKLSVALKFLTEMSKQGKVILYIGTKPSAKDIIKKYAQEINISYVIERWLGGTLTNFSTILKLIEKLNKMTEEREKGEWGKYSKKERLVKEKEIKRLEIMVGGIRLLKKRPDIIYLIDLQEEKTAIREARKCKIPVVAIVDTNANPELIDWPIPANDDAIKSIDLITGLVTEAIKMGRTNQEKINPPSVN